MREFEAYLEAVAIGDHASATPLFVLAWEQLERVYLERLAAAVREAEAWRDRFRAGATLTVELVEEHPREAAFLVVDALEAGSVGRDRQRRIGDHLTSLVDTAREELDDPDSVPPATAAWIVGVFFGQVYRRCSGRSPTDLRAQLPELLFLGISAYFGTEIGRAHV